MTATVLATTNPNIVDWTKRHDPDGKSSKIAELLDKQTPLLGDMVVREANQATGHILTSRTSLPTVTARLFNQGVAASKSTTAQVTESISMYETRSEIDVALAKLNGDSAGFRLSEARAFINKMNQTIEDKLFNGVKAVTPADFNGFLQRYASTTGDTGDNVILAEPTAGAGTDFMSMVVVVWGEDTVFTIFPKGSMAGLGHMELDDDYVDDADGNKFFAHRDRWTWDIGIALYDWRYAVRIANIDKSRLDAAIAAGTPTTSAPNLVNSLIEATHRIPNLSVGRPVIYMNRICAKLLHFQCNLLGQYMLTTQTVEGRARTDFLGIPIRITDSLPITESELV